MIIFAPRKMMIQDDYIHKGLRQKMIDSLAQKGISQKAVLEAMNKVPRHLFLDTVFLKYAYQDRAFSIGQGQTISHPYTVAFQSSLLQISPGDKVLEIGTGSGYQACVLIEMGAKVYSIERQKALYNKTKKLLSHLRYNRIHTFYGDGYKGLPAYAPFDKILITAAAPYIPETLLHQLKIGGSILAPLNREDGRQEMTLIRRQSEKDISISHHGDFSFVPMLKDKT